MTRQRKWYQFTVRSLLIVTVLVAILGAAYRYRQSYLQGKQPRNYAEGLRLAVHGLVDDGGSIEVRCSVSNHSGKSRALLVEPSALFELETRDGVLQSDGVLFAPNNEQFGRRYVVVSPTSKGETKFHPAEVLSKYYHLKTGKDENLVGGKITATLWLFEIVRDETEGLTEVEFSVEGTGDIRKAASKK